MGENRDPVKALLHARLMLKAIGYINEDLQGHTKDTFETDRRTRQLVERNLGNISESCRWLLDEQTASEPGVAWRSVADFGNIFRHAYWTASATRVWNESVLQMPDINAAL